VVLATGYKAHLDQMIPELSGHLDHYNLPKGPIGEGVLQGLYFIGFDNYKLGGILGTIASDSALIVRSLIR